MVQVLVYHAIFSSHMIYGCQIWGQGNKENILKIERLQNRALRTINFKGPREEAQPLYADNKILQLKDLIKLNNCLFIHDYLHNLLPDCFQNFYLPLNSLYFVGTKNAKLGCLFVPFKNTTKYGINSITHHSILTWNSLCKLLNTNLAQKSRYDLKSLLTGYFLDQYGETDNNNNNNHINNNPANNNINLNNNRNRNNVNNINNNNIHNHNNNNNIGYNQFPREFAHGRFNSRWDR